ncbi:MAG TPA: hypothetical protein VGK48_20825 [Terriglobia bacterium]
MAHSKHIKEDGRVFRVTNIDVTIIFKHPLYSLEFQESATLGPTGAWPVLVLTHASGWPIYKGRWGENAKAFDIEKFIETSTKPIKGFLGRRRELSFTSSKSRLKIPNPFSPT